jgi:uncharacterized membrane protein
MKRLYDLLNAAFLAITTFTVASRYPGLPDRIPVHFGISGAPDRWGAKSEIFILVGVMWGLTIIFYSLNLAMPRLARNPQYLNIPNKQAFLKLPAERQAIFFALLREFMTGMTASVNLLFFLIVGGILRVAEGKTSGVPLKDVLAGLVALGLMMVVYFPRLITLPKKLIRGDEF